MTKIAITHNTTVQNDTVDSQYTGSNLIRIFQGSPDFNMDSPSELGGMGNFSTENSSTIFTFAGLTANLPAGCVVNSATLYFRTAGVFGGGNTSAWHILRNIVHGDVTWNSWSSGNSWATAGATGTGDSTSPTGADVDLNATDTWFGYDVTDDVQAISDATAPNYGWMVRCNVQDTSSMFRTAHNEEATDGLRPELIVDYTVIASPTITNVAGTWRPGNSLVLTTALMSTITSATLGGQALTITGTATDEVTVLVPTDIALLWGGAFTLQVGDGVDTATLAAQTLLDRTGWTAVVYAGPEPDPVTTEGFYEYAEVYRTFSAAVGDQVQFTDFTGMTVADTWLPTISPAAYATGTYAIYDVSEGTRLSEEPYIIAQDISLLPSSSGSNRLALKIGLGL